MEDLALEDVCVYTNPTTAKIDRGIDIHMFHWNVYVNGVEGKRGIEWRHKCEATMLESALEAWKNYAQTATAYYNPQLLARSQKLD